MRSITTKMFSIAGMLVILCIACGFDGCKNPVKIKGAVITATNDTTAQFTRHTVTGITTPLPVAPDVPGYLGAAFITVGDLDNDSIKEIICTSGVGQDKSATTSDGDVAVFTWDGKNIDSWQQNIINDTFSFPNETVIKDINHDGHKDIVVMDNFLFGGNPAGIYWLQNKGGDIKSPDNWVKRTILKGDKTTALGRSSYHRAVFIDLDGDGREDFITAKVCPDNYFQNNGERYSWIEWFKNVDDNGTFSGPYDIADAGGFFFTLTDINRDGKIDIVVPQFFNTKPSTCEIFGSEEVPDPRGDSLLWLENPGNITTSTPAWKYHTIDYWYTSKNKLGKADDVVLADMDNDGYQELVLGTHNHQGYISDKRLWPAGVYTLDIPLINPGSTGKWQPITIDSGDPDLDPADAAAVAADPYAVDRPGGPGSQGSPGMVKAGDINGDGYPDLVVPGDGKGAIYYYESSPMKSGKLQYKRAELYVDKACMPAEPEIVDIDGDGKMDIVAAVYDTSVNKNSMSGSIFIFKQN